MKPRIAVYVLDRYAKQTYKKESFNVRQNAGIAVVVDILRRGGHTIEYAGIASVLKYDFILVSITSDCDWFPYVAERLKWPTGKYRVVVGGAGVLNIRALLPFADYFVFGRAEGIVCELLSGTYDGDSVAEGKTFGKHQHYRINQSPRTYPESVRLESGTTYKETMVGCQHRCLFCSYTWHRRNVGGDFCYGDLWGKNPGVELPILDMADKQVNYGVLQTTAIDGMSERLRFAVGKKISSEMFRGFLVDHQRNSKAGRLRLYNILGYPSETEADWDEFYGDIVAVDRQIPRASKQHGYVLHSTPFRAMPGTPMACKPMQYVNFRGAVARVLGRGLKGGLIYQGGSIWVVEGLGTESLPTVFCSAIILRGVESDTDNVARLASSSLILEGIRFSAAGNARKVF